MRRHLTPIAISLALTGAWSTASLAEEAPTPPTALDEPQRLSLEEMDALSGGDAVEVNVLNNQQLTATSQNNTVTAHTLSSGDVAFSQDALSGFSGIGNFVINTGANNTLQGSISVNIVTAPLP